MELSPRKTLHFASPTEVLKNHSQVNMASTEAKRLVKTLYFFVHDIVIINIASRIQNSVLPLMKQAISASLNSANPLFPKVSERSAIADLSVERAESGLDYRQRIITLRESRSGKTVCNVIERRLRNTNKCHPLTCNLSKTHI